MLGQRPDRRLEPLSHRPVAQGDLGVLGASATTA
jgi:hypothetical protein